MQFHSRKLPALALAACTVLTVSGMAVAADFPETEPNDTKAAANAVTLAPGDTISGLTTGSSTTVAGDGSADYFNITTTAAGTAGWYRNRLIITTAGAAGHTGSLRGLTQTDAGVGVGGTSNPGTDATLQTSSTTSTPPRFVQWYSNEAASQVVFRIVGTASTTSNYTVTFERTPVAVSNFGTFSPGQVVITTVAQGHSTDTDLYLYDSARTVITGNDDESTLTGGTGTTLQSRLRPTLNAGTYYLVVGAYDTSTNLAAASDDDFRLGVVADFPNAIATTSTSTNQNVSFLVAAGNTIQVPATRVGIFDLSIHEFTVSGVAGPSVSGCTASVTPVAPGGSTVLSATVTPGGSPTITSVTANLSAFGLGTVNLADQGGGVWSYNLTVPGSQGAGPYNIVVQAIDGNSNIGGCTIQLTVPIGNDTCATATTVAVGTTAGNNASATTEFTVTCTTSNKDLFYSFTAPPSGGTYVFDTENSAQGDTVLSLHDSTCATQLACDDDSGTGNWSRIQYSLAGNQLVKIRVASFGSAPAGGGFNLNITSLVSGACCNSTTNACTITTQAGCTVGPYQGDNTTCSPSPCGPTNPTGVGAFSPNPVPELGVATLRVTVTPGDTPPSAGLAVVADATLLGGSSTVTLLDDGNAPDLMMGDNIFTANVTTTVGAGTYAVPFTVSDNFPRSTNGSFNVTIAAFAGACCNGTTCSVATGAVACTGGGGTYLGAGTTCGGPFYSVATGSDAFASIAGTGTALATVGGCDDCGEVVALPFSFTYLGTAYTDVWVCSNGFIQFPGAGGPNNATLGNVAIPNSAVPNNIIAALWDDLNPGVQGDIYTQLDGVGPAQTFTISYEVVREFGTTSNVSSFQIILHETTNRVEIRYGSIAPQATAGDYTIGFEDANGLAGVNVDPVSIGSGNTELDLNPITLPDPCAASDGACCQGSTCTILSMAACTGANTAYSGDGTTCNVFPAALTPCCFADFNHVGGITVQDIFDFLQAYFGGSSFANINGAGGTTVQDIFDFLQSYFAGGC